MSIGAKIRESRKKKGWRMEDLGRAVGLSKSAISKIETGEVKSSLDPHLLIRMAETLEDPTILIHYCQTCPARRHLLSTYFPDLQDLNDDPAAILTRLRREFLEGAHLLQTMVEKLPETGEGAEYGEALRRVIELRRRWEVLEFQLILAKKTRP